jgi:hypothetical protein
MNAIRKSPQQKIAGFPKDHSRDFFNYTHKRIHYQKERRPITLKVKKGRLSI